MVCSSGAISRGMRVNRIYRRRKCTVCRFSEEESIFVVDAVIVFVIVVVIVVGGMHLNRVPNFRYQGGSRFDRLVSPQLALSAITFLLPTAPLNEEIDDGTSQTSKN